MPQNMKLGVALLALFATSGCASLRVGSDYDRDVSFAARETYDWVDSPEEDAQDKLPVVPQAAKDQSPGIEGALHYSQLARTGVRSQATSRKAATTRTSPG